MSTAAVEEAETGDSNSLPSYCASDPSVHRPQCQLIGGRLPTQHTRPVRWEGARGTLARRSKQQQHCPGPARASSAGSQECTWAIASRDLRRAGKSFPADEAMASEQRTSAIAGQGRRQATRAELGWRPRGGKFSFEMRDPISAPVSRILPACG